MTFKKAVTIALLGVAILAGAANLSAHSATLTQEQFNVQQESGIRSAQASAACAILAKFAGEDQITVGIFVKRIGEFKGHLSVAYTVGYTMGSLDIYGTVNAKHFGTFSLARTDAAKHLYKLQSCNTGEVI